MPIRLNDLLANPDSFRSKLVALRAGFAEAVDIRKELELLPPNRGWSILVLDQDYRQPIQLFTTQDPAKFPKNQNVLIAGFFLTNRIDHSRSGMSAKPLVIPMLVGVIVPIHEGKNFTIRATSHKTIFNIVAGILVLVALFVLLKIYLYKSSAKMKVGLLKSQRGPENGKGTTQSGG